ncbi:unnamed protein product, partial [Prorocentrum cordatum]
VYSGDKNVSVMGRRFRPALGEADGRPRPFLRRSLSYYKREKFGQKSPFPDIQEYKLIFRSLCFLQAVVVTSLIVAYLGHPPDNWVDIGLFGLALAAWPFTGLSVLPTFIRRLTMRSSIEGDKDKALIREGLLAAKEGLLRDFARLVQVAGFERRAMERGEPWATCDDARWTVVDARRAFQRGAAAFEKLPKTEQEEIWQLFAAADPDNDGEVEEREMAELFGFAMGRGSRALAGYGAAVPGQGIIRLVDFDGRRAVTWPKFQETSRDLGRQLGGARGPRG